MNQETNVQEARVRQPWTAQRVGDILLNNALLIIMAIAVVYIAIKRLYCADRYRPVRRPCRGYHRLYLCVSAAKRR